jgi:hypothetical protein
MIKVKVVEYQDGEIIDSEEFDSLEEAERNVVATAATEYAFEVMNWLHGDPTEQSLSIKNGDAYTDVWSARVV